MRCPNALIRSVTACGLTAAALLACGGSARAQRPGGIGGQAGGGSIPAGASGLAPSLAGGNGLMSNSSAALSGVSGSAFGSGPALYGTAGGAGPLSGSGLSGAGTSGSALLQGGLAPGMSAAPGLPLPGGPGAVGGGSSAPAPGASSRARAGVSPYGALGVIPPARPTRFAGPRQAAHLAPLSPAMQADFRDLASRSDSISPATSAGVEFGLDGTSVVLRGRAADGAEARALENLIRFAPGVRAVRNEMTWPAP